MAASFTGNGDGYVIVVLADLLVVCDCCSYWFASKKRETETRRERERERERERDEEKRKNIKYLKEEL